MVRRQNFVTGLVVFKESSWNYDFSKIYSVLMLLRQVSYMTVDEQINRIETEMTSAYHYFGNIVIVI